jgi:hypothetical protein
MEIWRPQHDDRGALLTEITRLSSLVQDERTWKLLTQDGKRLRAGNDSGIAIHTFDPCLRAISPV